MNKIYNNNGNKNYFTADLRPGYSAVDAAQLMDGVHKLIANRAALAAVTALVLAVVAAGLAPLLNA